jgi:phosphoserine phosphatase
MQTADAAPVLVFDLDETILRVNSFPLWVRFLIAGRLPGLGWRRRALLSLHAQRLLLWRKLGRLSHDALRWRLLLAWQSATGHRRERSVARFQARLLREVRANLRPLLAMVAAEQIDAVLATAAGAEYAEGLGRRLGFRYVLASRHDGHAATPANSGSRKRDRVLAFLREHDWSGRKLVLFTDHLDDLSLMQESDAVCWFGSDATMATAEALAAGPRFIRGPGLDGDTLVALLDALPVPAGDQSAGAWRAMTAA